MCLMAATNAVHCRTAVIPVFAWVGMLDHYCRVCFKEENLTVAPKPEIYAGIIESKLGLQLSERIHCFRAQESRQQEKSELLPNWRPFGPNLAS
jgi:hypothetical protein